MIYLGLGQNSTNKHQVKMTRPPHGTTSASVNSYRVDFEESSGGRLEVPLAKDGNSESFDESSHLYPKLEKVAYTLEPTCKVHRYKVFSHVRSVFGWCRS